MKIYTYVKICGNIVCWAQKLFLQLLLVSVHSAVIDIVSIPIIKLSLEVKSSLRFIFARLRISDLRLYLSPILQFYSIHLQGLQSFVQIVNPSQRVLFLIELYWLLFRFLPILLPFIHRITLRSSWYLVGSLVRVACVHQMRGLMVRSMHVWLMHLI